MKKRGQVQKALSTMQVAEQCGVHYTTVRRWILEGNLPAYETPGGHLRVLDADVHAFLESRKLRGWRDLTGTLRVLVVDDDAAFRESATEFLGRQPNMRVRQAADGFAAGRQVSEFQPHIVILDLLMAGMNGLDVCRNIKASPRSRQTRILVLTGYATTENIEKAKEAGADLCMAKPVGLDELHDAVLRLARGSSDAEGVSGSGTAPKS
ncbi:MAG: response regulator [Candidatus Brocadiia bacterium]